jgi:hypothetical protein
MANKIRSVKQIRNKNISKSGIKKNHLFNLKGGLNCSLVIDHNECISRAPECLWNLKNRKCIDNPIIQVDHAPVPAHIVAAPAELQLDDKFKPSFTISPQLERLCTQLGITHNMRNAVDADITNDELDALLNEIKIESSKKDNLMSIVNSIITSENIEDANEIINIKIKVLLDNLAKKLCRCTGKISDSQKESTAEKKKLSSEAVCRSSIFQKRGIDYITHDCGDATLNPEKYNYKMGPLLRPFLGVSSDIILRRYHDKRQ